MAKFCSNCGAELNEEQEICLKCGVRVKNSDTKNTDPNAKSKMAAGLLGIFLGQWGVHNFYLGYTGKAVAQLLLSIFGYILLFVVVGFFMVAAAGIWGLIEGIMILSGSINTDANGNPLNAVNINNAAQPTTNGTNAYNDRMNMARMGTRRKCKK